VREHKTWLDVEKKNVLSLRRKEAIEQLLRISEGRKFQIVGAATEKLLEPKHVRTRATDNRLVSDERNVRAGVQCVNGPCLLDYLMIKSRLPVVLYVSFAVD